MNPFFINSMFDKLSKNNNINIKISQLSNYTIDINPTPIYIKELVQCFSLLNVNLKQYINETYDSSSIKIETALAEEKIDFFFTENYSAANINYIMNSTDNKYVNLIRYEVEQGIADILKNTYQFTDNFKVIIDKSTILTYDNYTFLNIHKHFQIKGTGVKELFFVGVYYIDDGDPEINNKYCGCVSFLTNNKNFHVRPRSGTLLLWEGDLPHLVNPFFSKSNKKRIVLTMNIRVVI